MKGHLNEHTALRFECLSPELLFSLAVVLIVYFFYTQRGRIFFSFDSRMRQTVEKQVC